MSMSEVRAFPGEPNKKGNSMSAYNTHNDPMKHHSGRPRLGPLNVAQLTKMLETARPKNRAKIQRAIDYKQHIQQTITKS